MAPVGFAQSMIDWRNRAAARGVEIRPVSGADIVFDPRTQLKCKFGCPAWGARWTCGDDAWGPERLIPLLERYSSVLIVSGVDLTAVTGLALEIEREATVGGYPFALAVAVTMCSTCEGCTYPGEECRKEAELRPESAMAGIHTMETMRRLGIPFQTSEGWVRTSYVFLE